MKTGRVVLSLLIVLSAMLMSVDVGVADDSKALNVERSGSEDENVCLRAILPTPVYSDKNILSLYYDNDTLEPRIKHDNLGHVRELEFIALPGSKFRVVRYFMSGKISIYEVVTNEYPTKKHLFVDSNFVARCSTNQPERKKVLPSREEILASLEKMVGMPYRWGGNYYEGIEQLLDFYPLGDSKTARDLSDDDKDAWILRGVDCSGMLYQATDGTIPRNTIDLVDFGKSVDIVGLSIDQILTKLEPLDLIVWNGHIVVVYDEENVIESRPRYRDGEKGGVRIHSLKKRLEGLLSTKDAVNKYDRTSRKKQFVIRRFM